MAKEELIQCGFCGRCGDGVTIDTQKSVKRCNYCGKTFFLNRKDDKTLADEIAQRLGQWREEEVNNCRILLSETLLTPDCNSDNFIGSVDMRANSVLEKCRDDFLAKTCKEMILAERARNAVKRSEILKQIGKCGDHPEDILGLILFVRRMKKIWPYYYEKGHGLLLDAAKKFDLVVPPEGDHSGETDLTPVTEEKTCFSQDIPARCMVGNTLTEAVELDGNVKKIGESAFDGCENLAQVTLGPNVREIGGSAFCGCRSLSTVTVPASVTSIGACAFRGCKLEEAVFEDPEGWYVISIEGNQEEISAAELRNRSRAAGYLSKKYRNVKSYENWEWRKGK